MQTNLVQYPSSSQPGPLPALLNAWAECIGSPSPIQQRQFAAWLRAGHTPDMLEAAILATAAAPSPSWRYMIAIMRRCSAERCLTLQDWEQRNAAYQRRAPAGRTVTAQQYKQREYTEAELSASTVQMLAEAARREEAERLEALAL